MDPNAILNEIQEILLEPENVIFDENSLRLEELVAALDEWLVKGGFEPRWDDYEVARDYYQADYQD